MNRDYLIQHPRWGKLLGAILGFLMAGPVGAFLGILIGNFFDQGLAQHLAKPHGAFRTERNKHTKTIFLHATFSIMGAIAKANGRVSEHSIQMAQRLMSEMGLNKTQRQQAQHDFNRGKQTTFNLTPILLQLKSVTQDNPLLLKLFITLQYEHAENIGFSPHNIQLMNQVLHILGFSPLHQQAYTDNQRTQQQYSQQQTSHHSHSINQAYRVLAVAPDASKAEIKRAYRRLISQHHPDKAISKGGGKEQIKAANEQTQRITKAYEQICASRGW